VDIGPAGIHIYNLSVGNRHTCAFWQWPWPSIQGSIFLHFDPNNMMQEKASISSS